MPSPVTLGATPGPVGTAPALHTPPAPTGKIQALPQASSDTQSIPGRLPKEPSATPKSTPTDYGHRTEAPGDSPAVTLRIARTGDRNQRRTTTYGAEHGPVTPGGTNGGIPRPRGTYAKGQGELTT